MNVLKKFCSDEVVNNLICNFANISTKEYYCKKVIRRATGFPDGVTQICLEFSRIAPVRVFPDGVIFQRNTTYDVHRCVSVKDEVSIYTRCVMYSVCRPIPYNRKYVRKIGVLVIFEPELSSGRDAILCGWDPWTFEECLLSRCEEKKYNIPRSHFKPFFLSFDEKYQTTVKSRIWPKVEPSIYHKFATSERLVFPVLETTDPRNNLIWNLDSSAQVSNSMSRAMVKFDGKRLQIFW